MKIAVAFYNEEAESFISAFSEISVSDLITEVGQKKFTLCLMGKGVGRAKARNLTAFAVQIAESININNKGNEEI